MNLSVHTSATMGRLGKGKGSPLMHLSRCNTPSAGVTREQRWPAAEQVHRIPVGPASGSRPRERPYLLAGEARGGQSLVDWGPLTFHPDARFIPGTSWSPCPLAQKWPTFR